MLHFSVNPSSCRNNTPQTNGRADATLYPAQDGPGAVIVDNDYNAQPPSYNAKPQNYNAQSAGYI